jgi:iron-sulfur cluster assembly protein
MITLTERAATQVQGVMDREGKPNFGLRVFVQSGGCSGFQYGMRLDEEPLTGDRVFESHGVKVFVDPRSLPYLSGSEVDFVHDSMLGGGFKIENPNAVASCGCGHSFKTAEQAASGSCCG